MIAQDSAARYGLVGFYQGTPPPPLGPSLIQGDPTAASRLFDTAGQCVEVPDAPQLEIEISGDFSLEVWIVPYVTGQTGMIIGKLDSTGTWPAPYALCLNSDQIQFSIGDGQSTSSLLGDIPALSQPSHIVATSFRSTLSIYINGVLDAIGPLGAQDIDDAGEPVYIGGSPVNVGFVGLISEAALYNGALSARQVARHHAVGQQTLSDPAHYNTVDPPVFSF